MSNFSEFSFIHRVLWYQTPILHSSLNATIHMNSVESFRLCNLLIFLEVLQCYHRLQFLFLRLSGCVHVHIYTYICVTHACVSLRTQNHLCAMQSIFIGNYKTQLPQRFLYLVRGNHSLAAWIPHFYILYTFSAISIANTKCVVSANVRRDAYFLNPIPRYRTLQQHSDSALESWL